MIRNVAGDEDDFFGDGDIGNRMVDSTVEKISRKLEKDGYRIGKELEENNLLQKGFNDGFNFGSQLGKRLGEFYGLIRFDYMTFTSSGDISIREIEEKQVLFRSLEKILLDFIPGSFSGSNDSMDGIANCQRVILDQLNSKIAEIRHLAGALSDNSNLLASLSRLEELCEIDK